VHRSGGRHRVAFRLVSGGQGKQNRPGGTRLAARGHQQPVVEQAQEALRDMARRGEEMAGEPLDGAAVLDWSRDAAAQLKSMLADEGAMYEFQSQCGLRGNATRPAAERFGNGVAWLRAKADSLTFNDLKATYRNRK
jgi:hypothetical protein